MTLDLGDCTLLSFREIFSKTEKEFASSINRVCLATVSRQVNSERDKILSRNCDYYGWVKVPEGAIRAILKVGKRALEFKVNEGIINLDLEILRTRTSISLQFKGATSTSTQVQVGFFDTVKRRESLLSNEKVTEIKYNGRKVGEISIKDGNAVLKN